VVLDLDEFRAQLGHPIDGVLGWDFFESLCSTFDFASGKLLLRDRENCTPPAGPHGTLKGDWSVHGLQLSSVITFPNGRTAQARLQFDTGNDATLLLNPKFRAASGLSEAQPVEGAGWGANGQYAGDIVPITSLVLEDGKIHMDSAGDTTIMIGWPGAFAHMRNLDGMIGNQLLERITWTLDPAAKRVYFVLVSSEPKPRTETPAQ
jgi:hypothetical protein